MHRRMKARKAQEHLRERGADGACRGAPRTGTRHRWSPRAGSCPQRKPTTVIAHAETPRGTWAPRVIATEIELVPTVRGSVIGVEGARGQLRGRGTAQRGFRQPGVFRPQQVPGDRAHDDAAGRHSDHRYRQAEELDDVRTDEDRTQDEEERVRRDTTSELCALGVAQALRHREEHRGAAHRVDDREQRREHEQRLSDQVANVDVEEFGHRKFRAPITALAREACVRPAGLSIRRRGNGCQGRRGGGEWKGMCPPRKEKGTRHL